MSLLADCCDVARLVSHYVPDCILNHGDLFSALADPMTYYLLDLAMNGTSPQQNQTQARQNSSIGQTTGAVPPQFFQQYMQVMDQKYIQIFNQMGERFNATISNMNNFYNQRFEELNQNYTNAFDLLKEQNQNLTDKYADLLKELKELKAGKKKDKYVVPDLLKENDIVPSTTLEKFIHPYSPIPGLLQETTVLPTLDLKKFVPSYTSVPKFFKDNSIDPTLALETLNIRPLVISKLFPEDHVAVYLTRAALDLKSPIILKLLAENQLASSTSLESFAPQHLVGPKLLTENKIIPTLSIGNLDTKYIPVLKLLLENQVVPNLTLQSAYLISPIITKLINENKVNPVTSLELYAPGNLSITRLLQDKPVPSNLTFQPLDLALSPISKKFLPENLVTPGLTLGSADFKNFIIYSLLAENRQIPSLLREVWETNYNQPPKPNLLQEQFIPVSLSLNPFDADPMTPLSEFLGEDEVPPVLTIGAWATNKRGKTDKKIIPNLYLTPSYETCSLSGTDLGLGNICHTGNSLKQIQIFFNDGVKVSRDLLRTRPNKAKIVDGKLQFVTPRANAKPAYFMEPRDEYTRPGAELYELSKIAIMEAENGIKPIPEVVEFFASRKDAFEDGELNFGLFDVVRISKSAVNSQTTYYARMDGFKVGDEVILEPETVAEGTERTRVIEKAAENQTILDEIKERQKKLLNKLFSYDDWKQPTGN